MNYLKKSLKINEFGLDIIGRRTEVMKTVKMVSEITGISIRTLRYYDEIGLLKPKKYAIRRYYGV